MADSVVLCRPDVSVPVPKTHLCSQDEEEPSVMERLLKKCQLKNQLCRECLAEVLGVYVLIVSISTNVSMNLVARVTMFRWMSATRLFLSNASSLKAPKRMQQIFFACNLIACKI